MKGVDLPKPPKAIKFWSDKKIRPLMVKIGYRWYRIKEQVKVNVLTEDGTLLEYTIEEGFCFDSRSGGKFVDLFLPHIGSELFIMSWLVHDLNGYAQYYSFRDTNDLLYSMLTIAGAYTWQVKAAHAVGVNDFWFGEPKPGEKEYPNMYPKQLFDLRYRVWR